MDSSVREEQTPLDAGQAHVIVLGLTGIEVRYTDQCLYCSI